MTEMFKNFVSRRGLLKTGGAAVAATAIGGITGFPYVSGAKFSAEA